MNDEKQRKERLDWMSKNKMVPFDLDFLRELGFKFGLDWDGQLIIEYPDAISTLYMANLIKIFQDGIKVRLYFEGQKAQRVYVGGPLNGKPYFGCRTPNQPLCCHIKRGEWLVYVVKSYEDPRAWYVGRASSKKKAKRCVK